ncbi:DUF309 domain-containing protein [Sulfurimonas sp.]|nr:DUF309 domain-containing protein [Sulfurimonas sp.]
MREEITKQKHKELLDEFKDLLDESRFYDAHESLEEIWFPRRFEDDAEMKLLKGFINASVSFELIKKGRLESSDKVWKNYIKYIPLLDVVESEFKKDYESIKLHVEKTKKKLTIN